MVRNGLTDIDLINYLDLNELNLYRRGFELSKIDSMRDNDDLTYMISLLLAKNSGSKFMTRSNRLDKTEKMLVLGEEMSSYSKEKEKDIEKSLELVEKMIEEQAKVKEG